MPDARPSMALATLLLVAGRLAGSAAAFAIPVVLARLLEPHEFGTYKQIFLIYATGYSIAQAGMAESLYYFVPNEPARAGQWTANATAALGVVGLACVGLGVLLAGPVAEWLSNPALAGFVPALSVFLALMLVSAVLEIVMIADANHRGAAVTYAISDVGRTALILAPALVTRSVGGVLLGAVIFAGLRVAATLGYLAKRFRREWRPSASLLRRQWRYAVPFAAAVTLEVVQVSYHQYAVSAWFDPTTFAIYAVGCLQIPLVDLVATSAGNVLMVRMGEARCAAAEALSLWHEAVDRLALVLLPLAVGLMIVAHDLIVALFTSTYAASVPIFLVTASMVALAVLPVDAVLRSLAETRFLFALNVGRLAAVAGGIGWFIGTFGLVGAVLVTALTGAAAKAVALRRIATRLGAGARELLPWRGLGGTAAAALVAAAPALLVRSELELPPAAAVLVVGAVYAAAYVVVMSRLRPRDARLLLDALLSRMPVAAWRRWARAA